MDVQHNHPALLAAVDCLQRCAEAAPRPSQPLAACLYPGAQPLDDAGAQRPAALARCLWPRACWGQSWGSSALERVQGPTGPPPTACALKTAPARRKSTPLAPAAAAGRRTQPGAQGERQEGKRRGLAALALPCTRPEATHADSAGRYLFLFIVRVFQRTAPALLRIPSKKSC